MMSKQSGLGKGLDALLPTSESEAGDFFVCAIDSIEPNPEQPRKLIDDKALGQLANSIKEKGVLLPLVVAETDSGMFQIIAGERRWRAAQLAGLDELPVLVKDVSPLDRLELGLIENIQRQDLNPLEEAEAYLRLVKEFGLTQEDVARRVGKERSTVANALRINQLPEFAKEDLVTGVLTMGHARVLLSLADEETMLAVRDEIVKQHLNVRQTESLAKKYKKGSSGAKKKKKIINQLPESYCRKLSSNLVDYLGTKTKIVQKGDRGKLEIAYSSPEDLERLKALILSD